ncbi:Protein of unknown function (DUF2889) [Dongia mobilis]|uniref:DUF2889 family protein n=1 Tax=Dongia mobilis TaxID=578943 RepID=A0A4R6WWF5_9PROT|nr:DUF2889 domain-containing protein [Dongia mobilis]TDQ84530.1 Protein of unknown function (DUF2889) [Dongia mobilis]
MTAKAGTAPLTDLPPPVEREALHTRTYHFRGFHRADGLFDIEGRMVDTKDYAFPNEFRGMVEPGEPLHDMIIRLTIDLDFVVHDIAVVTAAAPYSICPAITPAFDAVKGMSVSKGWSKNLIATFGGAHGCTHHIEMLRAMGTVAFQTLFGWKEKRKREMGGATSAGPTTTTPGKRPGFLDTCHALASDGDVVREHWPEFYTGNREI